MLLLLPLPLLPAPLGSKAAGLVPAAELLRVKAATAIAAARLSLMAVDWYLPIICFLACVLLPKSNLEM